MRQRVLWLLAVVVLPLAVAAAFGLNGAAPFGRLALSLGLSGPAAVLLDDPQWRGIALYRAGRFEEAAEAFRAAGPKASFNRGNALTRAGRYREAVAAYDAALYRTPGHDAVRYNRDLVSPLVTAVVGEVRAGGRIAAGSSTDGPTRDGKTVEPVPAEPNISDVRRAFDGQSIIASRQWLTTLADDPGRYLKLRIAAERRQRRDAGLAAPPAEQPW